VKRVESYSRVITHVDTLCAYYALRNASFITSATFLVARLNRMSLTVLNPISYRGLRNRLVSFRACEIANVDKRSEFRNWRLRRFIQQRLNNEIILLVILYRYLVYISTFLYKNAMIKIFNYAVIRCQVAGLRELFIIYWENLKSVYPWNGSKSFNFMYYYWII